MSKETTGIVRYGETSSPIADALTRYGLGGELAGSPLEPSGIPGFITEEQLARQLGVALSTVRRWKRRGYGPKFIKIGRVDYCKESAAAPVPILPASSGRRSSAATKPSSSISISVACCRRTRSGCSNSRLQRLAPAAAIEVPVP